MMNLDEARGIAAKAWTSHHNVRRRQIDGGICQAFSEILVEEVAKAKLDVEPTIAQARAVLKTALADVELRKAYVANIALVIHADQSSEAPANLPSLADCNVIADAIVKRILES